MVFYGMLRYSMVLYGMLRYSMGRVGYGIACVCCGIRLCSEREFCLSVAIQIHAEKISHPSRNTGSTEKTQRVCVNMVHYGTQRYDN